MIRMVIRFVAIALMCIGGWFVYTNLVSIDHSEDPAPLPDHTFSVTDVEGRSEKITLAPNRLAIPSLGINVPYHDSSVVRGKHQPELQIDDDPSVAVRWNGSERTSGSQIFAAHVNDHSAHLGPLAKINDAVAGTRIYVSDASGHVDEYASTSLKVYVKADLDQSIFKEKGGREIHVITCGGKIVRGDDGLFHHTDNVVLSGIPVKG